MSGRGVGGIYLHVGCGCLCFLYVGIAKALDEEAEEKFGIPRFRT